jgi:uncharacterized caspase-like protein
MTPPRRAKSLSRPSRGIGGWARAAGLAVSAAVSALAVLILLAPLALARPAQAEPGRRVALLVGLGEFADSAFTSLAYAHNDVEAMRKWLLSPKGGGFAASDVHVLLDAQATRAAIMREAESLAAQAGPDDLVLLYFSTHGFFTPDQVVGIVCYDTRATGRVDASGSPIVFRSQSLTRDDLYLYLHRLPARRQAVIVDVCHGGQLAGDALPAQAAGPTARVAAEDTSDQPKAADPGTAPDNADLVTLVLASCLGSERSWESQELNASIFTHYIIEGLKEKDGDLVAAFGLAQEETERQSRCEKGFCQTPYLVRQPPGRGLSLAPPPREG